MILITIRIGQLTNAGKCKSDQRCDYQVKPPPLRIQANDNMLGTTKYNSLENRNITDLIRAT